jgi:hypothetical protein
LFTTTSSRLKHVAAREVGFSPKLTQFLGEGFADVIASAGDDDSGAFTPECQRGGAANAGKCASDENNGSWHIDTLVR